MANYRNALVTDSEFINIFHNEPFELSWLLTLHKYSQKRHSQKKSGGSSEIGLSLLEMLPSSGSSVSLMPH